MPYCQRHERGKVWREKVRAIARERRSVGYDVPMKLMRGAAALGAAKMVYDQARKPENQAKLRSAVAKAKESRTRRSGQGKRATD